MSLLGKRPNSDPISIKQPALSPIYFFGAILFLIGIGDAIMSYVAPVIVEEHLNGTFIMGLVLSFSSVVGLVCDFIFSEMLRGKSYTFYMFLGFVMAITFPLVFLILPAHLIPFLLAMAVWGIYYECLAFADFHFIHFHVPKQLHADAWGVLSTIRSCAYLVGPIIASALLDRGNITALTSAIVFVTASLFGFLMFLKFSRYARKAHTKNRDVYAKENKSSALKEIRIWAVLLRRIWPLYLFIMAIHLLDSAFWTVGTVLSESLKDVSVFAQFLIPAYMLPSVFLGLLAGRAAKPFGKKRAAFLAGIAGGVLFTISGFVADVPLFVLVVFSASMVLSLAWPEINATIEDYVSRLGRFGNDIIGLQSSSISISYIIGPVASGFVASVFGNQRMFSVIGFVVLLVSILSLVIVPRKIKMPVSQLSRLE